MKVFFPAAFIASGFSVVWIALMSALLKRWADRIWAYLIVGAASVMVYTLIVGLTFDEYAVDYLPDYLVKLFM
ncbi:MAG: hypothetical protein KAS36_07500 [Anaerolineales bacterium]|nr:hypothetical protein [Anaerolineales bacterium]